MSHTDQTYSFTTLKGKALIAAVDAGLVKHEKKGYNVAPFMKFWESFSPDVEKLLEEHYDHWQSLQQEGENGTDDNEH